MMTAGPWLWLLICELVVGADRLFVAMRVAVVSSGKWLLEETPHDSTPKRRQPRQAVHCYQTWFGPNGFSLDLLGVDSTGSNQV